MSQDNLTPSFIARETLKRLALLKIPPTPDNYLKLYEQVAGNSSNQMSAITIKIVTELTKELPRHTPHLLNLTNSLEQAVDSKNWTKYKSILAKFVANEAESFVNQSRGSAAPSNGILDSAAPEQDHVTSNFSSQLLELLAQMLEHIAVIQIEDEALVEEAKILAQQVRKIQDKSELEQFAISFQQFCVKFEAHGDVGIKLQQGLLKLFNLLMHSTGELLSEDQWMKGQISRLKETMTKPLNMEVIIQAEHSLEEIIQRQKIIRVHPASAYLWV